MNDTSTPEFFDSYEVAPVHVTENGETAEACTTGTEAREEASKDGGSMVWGIYGHLPSGGVSWIADFSAELDALSLYAQITGRKVPETADQLHVLAPAIGVPTRHFPTDEHGRAL